MGAKTWMVVYSSTDVGDRLATKPPLDRNRSRELADRISPDHRLDQLEDADLLYTAPPAGEILVGCYPAVSIVIAEDLAIDFPSKIDSRFLEPGLQCYTCVHAMHSVVDWFAYAVWNRGKLVRALSISPDSGILENTGTPLEFEQPFWDGHVPAIGPEDDDFDEPYPLPFHPLELGEAALLDQFGFELEGVAAKINNPRLTARFDPEDVALLRFKRKRRGWFSRLRR